MKKSILTILVLVFTIFMGKAKSNEALYYSGYSYYETADGTQEMIPFAIVKICEAENPENIVAVALTSQNGSYEIRNIDVEKSYIVKVKPFDLAEQTFKIYPNNGRVKKFNISTNLGFKVPENYIPKQLDPRVFKATDYDQNLSLEAMLQQLPVLKVEDGEFYTQNDGTLKLLLNGIVANSSIYHKLKNFPIGQVVEAMDYIDLPKTDDAIFDGVLNIRLKVGKKYGKPNYTLKSLERLSK